MKTIGEIIAGREMITAREDFTILVAVKLMVKHKIGAVPITNSVGRVVGIFTERDLLKRVVATELDAANTPVNAVMTRKLVTANIDQSPYHCLRKMKLGNFRHLLITEGRNNIVGIVSQRQLMEVEFAAARRALDA